MIYSNQLTFYWVKEYIKKGKFHVYLKLGKGNLTYYFTKHHTASNNRVIMPIYIDPSNKQDRRRQLECVNYSIEIPRVKLTWKLVLLARRDNSDSK